jgi:hypothetical protein
MHMGDLKSFNKARLRNKVSSPSLPKVLYANGRFSD